MGRSALALLQKASFFDMRVEDVKDQGLVPLITSQCPSQLWDDQIRQDDKMSFKSKSRGTVSKVSAKEIKHYHRLGPFCVP